MDRQPRQPAAQRARQGARRGRRHAHARVPRRHVQGRGRHEGRPERPDQQPVEQLPRAGAQAARQQALREPDVRPRRARPQRRHMAPVLVLVLLQRLQPDRQLHQGGAARGRLGDDPDPPRRRRDAGPGDLRAARDGGVAPLGSGRSPPEHEAPDGLRGPRVARVVLRARPALDRALVRLRRRQAQEPGPLAQHRRRGRRGLALDPLARLLGRHQEGRQPAGLREPARTGRPQAVGRPADHGQEGRRAARTARGPADAARGAARPRRVGRLQDPRELRGAAGVRPQDPARPGGHDQLAARRPSRRPPRHSRSPRARAPSTSRRRSTRRSPTTST